MGFVVRNANLYWPASDSLAPSPQDAFHFRNQNFCEFGSRDDRNRLHLRTAQWARFTWTIFAAPTTKGQKLSHLDETDTKRFITNESEGQ
jgi:hypothetical protein